MSDPHQTARPVAIATYDLRASGTVVKALELAAALAHAGLPVEIWAIRGEGALKDRLPAGVPLRVLGGAWRSPRRAIDLALNWPRLLWRLRRAPPAVLLSSGNHFHLPAGLAIACCGRSIRYGVRVSNSSRRACVRHGQRRYRYGWLSAFKFVAADFAVAVSEELGEEVRFLKPSLRLLAISNGVDVERVRRAAAAPFAHPFLTSAPGAMTAAATLVSMGRICPQKGFDLLIRALAQLRRTRTVRLLIVGDGKAQAKAHLQALARALGVADAVDFLGYRANPFAVIARCDVYVNASRWEGCSNALLEALACGVNLAATDCPTGNREVVAAGAYGTLARSENEESLAEAIAAELDRKRDPAQQIAAAQARALPRCLRQWTDLMRAEYDQATT